MFNVIRRVLTYVGLNTGQMFCKSYALSGNVNKTFIHISYKND
jgi:hypothetical protein